MAQTRLNVLVFPPTHASGLGEHYRLTTDALRAHGVEIVLASDAPAHFKPDLVHLFDAPDIFTALPSLIRARAYDVPIFITPIYWNTERFYREGLPQADPPQGPHAQVEQNIRDAFQRAERAAQRALFLHAAMLNPSSDAETALLVRDFGIAPDRALPAWSGVKTLFAQATAELFAEKYGLRDFVLCAARFEIRKNQLALVRALRDAPLTLVFAGGTLAPGYRALCEQAARGGRVKLVFLPFLPPDEIASAGAAARVHALLSWYDCAPQAVLEAAVTRCRIVVTTESGIRDYLNADALFCDPADTDAIRRAVLTAMDTAPTDTLREHILQNYSWERSGAQTLAAYRQALERGNPTDVAAQTNALEQALATMAELAGLQELARARLWQEKESLARVVDGYANGRVLRALNALRRIVR